MKLAAASAALFASVLAFYELVIKDGKVSQQEIQEMREKYPGRKDQEAIDMLGGLLETAGAIESLSDAPSLIPSDMPSSVPSDSPSMVPSDLPSSMPSDLPSSMPSDLPSSMPSDLPSMIPSDLPSNLPSDFPSIVPLVWPEDDLGAAGFDTNEVEGTCTADGRYTLLPPVEARTSFGSLSGVPLIYSYKLFHTPLEEDSQEETLNGIVRSIERVFLEKVLFGYCSGIADLESPPIVSSRPMDYRTGSCGDDCQMVFGWLTPNTEAEVTPETSCQVKQIIFDTIQSGELASIPGIKMVDYRETSIAPCYVEIGGFNEDDTTGNGFGGMMASNRRMGISAAAGVSAATGGLLLAVGAVYMFHRRRASSHALSSSAEAALWVGSRLEV